MLIVPNLTKKTKQNTRSLTHQRTERNQVTISRILHPESTSRLWGKISFSVVYTLYLAVKQNIFQSLPSTEI